MDKKLFNRRLTALGIFPALCLIVCLVALFDAQIVNGENYLAQSIRSYTTQETVPASRGILTDRNGKVLISNRLTHTLLFDPALSSPETLNDDLLRLVRLLRAQDVAWEDALPLEAALPYAYADTSFAALNRYLDSLGWTELLPDVTGEPPALPAQELLSRLWEYYGGVSAGLTGDELRALVGLRYTLALAEAADSPVLTLVSDIDSPLITLLTDGDYAGVRIGSATARVYETEAAAHILGRVGKIPSGAWEDYRDRGYSYDALIGVDGVEAAFEEYLRCEDGTRLVTTNDSGKITSELYSTEPRNGATVALTIDIDLQERVERILADTIEQMTADDDTPRGGAAAVVQVGTGEVLALASAPTYSLAGFSENYTALLNDPLTPLYNRATQGLYAPGSTFKPLTAIAALESGVISPNTRITTLGQYTYYDLKLNCWLYSNTGRNHGTINVTQAITESCNYFFYDVGRMTGISTLARYAAAFGLGQPTGIEISEKLGAMTTPEYVNSLDGHYWTDGQTLTAAIGQSYNVFTPLQLANYIAALANGGTRCNAHLFKSAKTSDGETVLYDEPPAAVLDLKPENLKAVLTGMHNLAASGSVASYFRDCIVDAAAKTGTAQTGKAVSNGVFVCYAPFDDPQVAVAVVIEKGGSGGAVASTAVEILNACFAAPDAPSRGENTLLP